MVTAKKQDWQTWPGTWLIVSSTMSKGDVMQLIAGDIKKYGSLSEWTIDV